MIHGDELRVHEAGRSQLKDCKAEDTPFGARKLYIIPKLGLEMKPPKI
jgi:hypothetical protein